MLQTSIIPGTIAGEKITRYGKSFLNDFFLIEHRKEKQNR